MMYTALVPARSGSKRLPHKNIKQLGDKPLFTWTLQACVDTPQIDKVILSTDSREYWEIARKTISSDKLELDYRTPDEAGDKVKIFDYLKDKRSKIFGDSAGAFVLALPTVPLRTADQISESIQLFEKTGSPVFSATEYGFPISFAFSCHGESTWKPAFQDSPMITGNTRSQNQAKMYHPNGAIYVRKLDDLKMDDLKSLYSEAVSYIMDRTSSIDIDSLIDFQIAEALISKA